MRNDTMRPDLRGAVCLLLAVCLLGGLLPAAALAAEAEPTESTYHYLSNGFLDPIPEDDPTQTGAYREDSFLWSDDWFFTDGRETDYRLAALSATASIASAGYYTDNMADRSERDSCVREFLSAMEFEDIRTNAYYCRENLADSLACAVAHKTIASGGETATLLAIIPMSSHYLDEWAGNCNVGPDALHAGFLAGRDEALRFAKQYVGDLGIGGEIKVWTAGYSRGSAIVNLLGAFFAGGGAAYFGGGVTVAPEDVYCYTFATPSTVLDSGMTKAELLSVAGDRAAYPQDTAAAAYSYSESDAAAIMKPDDGAFSCVHNCRLPYDLITMLPPAQWGFTVFGGDITPDTGDAALKAKMEAALRKSDPAMYDAYKKPVELTAAVHTALKDIPLHVPFGTDGGEDVCDWIKIDFPNLTLAVGDGTIQIGAITSDGAYDTAEMMASRIAALCAAMNSQAVYYADYQETFSAAMGIFGMAWTVLSKQVDASVAKPLLLNYLAYASGRIGGENADAAAAGEVLLGLAEYLTDRKLGDYDKITVDELTDALARVLYQVLSKEENTLLNLGIAMAAPEELKQAVCTVLDDDEATILDILEKCAADATAEEGRRDVYALALAMLPEEQKELIYAIGYNTEAGVRVPDGSRAVRAAVKDLLPAIAVDDAGDPVSFELAADAALVEMVTALQARTLAAYRAEGFDESAAAQLSAHFETLKAHPKQVRDILMNALCYAGENYKTTDELRTLITFFTQSGKVVFAHFNELYVAWMHAAAGEVEEPERPEPIVFDDVSEADWSCDDIRYVAQRGLFLGTGEGAFSPKLGMTRGMLMAVLARLGGADAAGADWLEKAVAWCAANGVSDGSAPEREISRQELLTMLWRMAGSPEADTDVSDRPDVADAADWALHALRWAVEVGILKGTETGALLPAEGATREQVAAVIHRYAELTGK